MTCGNARPHYTGETMAVYPCTRLEWTASTVSLGRAANITEARSMLVKAGAMNEGDPLILADGSQFYPRGYYLAIGVFKT